MATLSGPVWVTQFPESKSVDDLKEPFRSSAKNFLAALKNAGAKVDIAATFRPPERAYLMHYAFEIARKGLDPSTVPAMPGVDIDWVHKAANGSPDPVASRTAAQQMVTAYGIVFEPVVQSRHTQGSAIDMDIFWSNDLTIAQFGATSTTIQSTPRTGANLDLQKVAAGYGVHKLITDPPHWSADGH